MYINNFNGYNQKNITFGYDLSEKMFDTKQSNSFQRYAYAIRKEQGQTAFHQYMNAVKTLQDKRFNAAPIVKEYWEQIKTQGKDAIRCFCDTLAEMQIERKEKGKSVHTSEIETYDGITEKLNLERLNAHIYLNDDLYYSNFKQKTLLCDWGTTREPLYEEKFIICKDDVPHYLSTTEGISDLMKTIDNGIEANLRSKLGEVVDKFKEKNDEEKLQQVLGQITDLFRQKGIGVPKSS